jgi:hypothetical protein
MQQSVLMKHLSNQNQQRFLQNVKTRQMVARVTTNIKNQKRSRPETYISNKKFIFIFWLDHYEHNCQKCPLHI